MQRYKTVRIPVQDLTQKQVQGIRDFLLKQPKWRMTADDELAENTNRYAKDGVGNQHWLWLKSNHTNSWYDFIIEWGYRHDPTMIKLDRKHLVMPGELFLCDLVGGELWVGRIGLIDSVTGRQKYEKLYQISSDMFKDYGNNFNGYARIPTDEEMGL